MSAARGALPLVGGVCWGVTAGKASHTARNTRGVTAGKMGRNSSVEKVHNLKMPTDEDTHPLKHESLRAICAGGNNETTHTSDNFKMDRSACYCLKKAH